MNPLEIAANVKFNPKDYRTVLCSFLDSMGNEFLLEKDVQSQYRGKEILNLKTRFEKGIKLTKRQSRILTLLEDELANQLRKKEHVTTEKSNSSNGPSEPILNEKTGIAGEIETNNVFTAAKSGLYEINGSEQVTISIGNE